MAKNKISQRSNKGVQSGKGITFQSKARNVKGVGGSADSACGSKVNSSEPEMVLTHERIAERAWAIWQSRGCRPDEDERNWREAETQLRTELGID